MKKLFEADDDLALDNPDAESDSAPPSPKPRSGGRNAAPPPEPEPEIDLENGPGLDDLPPADDDGADSENLPPEGDAGPTGEVGEAGDDTHAVTGEYNSSPVGDIEMTKEKGSYNTYKLRLSMGQIEVLLAALEKNHADPVSDELLATFRYYISKLPGPGEEEEESKGKGDNVDGEELAMPGTGDEADADMGSAGDSLDSIKKLPLPAKGEKPAGGKPPTGKPSAPPEEPGAEPTDEPEENDLGLEAPPEE